jgi:predicted GNAT family acetyltransferase
MTRPATIRHDEDRSRYEYLVDGRRLGVAAYRLSGDTVEMHHTEVDPGHRGQGIAAVLVAGALDDVRARGLRVVPTCWYVAQFVDEHPEYRDLLAAGA